MLEETTTLKDIVEKYMEHGDLNEMALESARTESKGYCKWTRIEEIIYFARRLNVQRLGIAFCIGLSKEARVAHDIFKANGFEVYSVCCKTGSTPKENIGLKDKEKNYPGRYEPICNPVGQAKLLSEAGTQLNVLVGLCVGHDTMFFMHSEAPVTVLIVKDRVLGHNPVASLNTAHSYYRRLKESQNAD